MPKSAANIYLIGPRGCGKTTVGSLLASQLGRPFIDLDHYLARRTGHCIADIVNAAGWPEFRRIESLCLAECGAKSGQVIATGGGIVLDAANRAFLNANGAVIWLDAPLELICRRLDENPEAAQRPALTMLDPAAEIAAVMAEREPLYQSCCHNRIAGAARPEAVCAAIRQALCI